MNQRGREIMGARDKWGRQSGLRHNLAHTPSCTNCRSVSPVRPTYQLLTNGVALQGSGVAAL